MTQQILNDLNPTGSIFVGYNPVARANAPLGPNLTTYDKTAGIDLNTPITIYRGVSGGYKQQKIVPGDFITTNPQLAKDYAGSGIVLQMAVKAKDIIDDHTDPLGEEYIYRPADEINNKLSKSATQAEVGCINVNGKRIDVKKLVDHISNCNSKYYHGFLATDNRSRHYDYAEKGDSISVDFKKAEVLSQGRHIGDFKTPVEVVRAIIQDASKNGVVLDSVVNAIWSVRKEKTTDISIADKIVVAVKPFVSSWKYANSGNEAQFSVKIELCGIYSFGCVKKQDVEAAKAAIQTQLNKPVIWKDITPKGVSYLHVECDAGDNTTVTFAGMDKPKNYSWKTAHAPTEVRMVAAQKILDCNGKYTAIGRLVDRTGKTVGLVLSDGKQQGRKALDWCIEHAEKGEISNVKAVRREGVKPYLQGKEKSLDTLQQIVV